MIRLGIRSHVHLHASPLHSVELLLPHSQSTHQVWGCRAVCRDTGCAQTLPHTISLCFNSTQTNSVQTPGEMATTLPPSPPSHLTRVCLSFAPPHPGKCCQCSSVGQIKGQGFVCCYVLLALSTRTPSMWSTSVCTIACQRPCTTTSTACTSSSRTGPPHKSGVVLVVEEVTVVGAGGQLGDGHGQCLLIPRVHLLLSAGLTKCSRQHHA